MIKPIKLIDNYTYDIVDIYKTRIGLKDIQVQLVHNLRNENGGQLMGTANAGLGVILVDVDIDKYPQQEVVDSYIHESLHVLLPQLNIELSESDVTALANGVLSMILDNEWSTVNTMYKKSCKGGTNAKPK